MRVILAFVVFLFVIVDEPLSQNSINDQGTRDTLSLSVSIPPTVGERSSVIIEAWVYSDDSILSFSAGFSWNSPKMYLDSAMASPLLRGTDNQVFLLSGDNLITSNTNRIFLLEGFTSGPAIMGDKNSRRLWATYYFTALNWNNTDTVSVDILPDVQVELAFVRSGPFYPVKYQPYFGGELLLFPGIVTSLDEDNNAVTLPDEVTLHQNYPNPFNPETNIEFEIPRRCQVQLEIFNSLGQLVTTIFDGEHPAGVTRFNWEARNESGAKMPSGVYFYRLRTPDIVLTKKMTLIK